MLEELLARSSRLGSPCSWIPWEQASQASSHPTAPLELGVVGLEQQSSEQGREISQGSVLVFPNLLPAPFSP